jgi:hypothetical protein
MSVESEQQKKILEEISMIRGLLEYADADPLVPAWTWIFYGGLMALGGFLCFLGLTLLHIPEWKVFAGVFAPLVVISGFIKMNIRMNQVKSRAVPFWTPVLVRLFVASLCVIGVIAAIFFLFLQSGHADRTVGLLSILIGLVIVMVGILTRFGIVVSGTSMVAGGIALLFVPLPLSWQMLWFGIVTGLPLIFCAPFAALGKKGQVGLE